MTDDGKVIGCECCHEGCGGGLHEIKEEGDYKRISLCEGEKFRKEIVPQWEAEVNELKTPEDLAKFVHHLMDDYSHDYGTVCHALGYAALAGAKVADRHPGQGGITGFQAGFVMWTFIRQWAHEDGPMKLVKFSNMLYPQYDDKFAPTISKSTWEWLQSEAERLLQESGACAAGPVVEHWKSIVAGKVPFGHTVVDD
jgi:hypothetical protein